MSNVWMALGLTLFAGLATGIGSAVAFTAKRTNYRFLSVATGFSAGVMLYVSSVASFILIRVLIALYGRTTGSPIGFPQKKCRIGYFSHPGFLSKPITERRVIRIVLLIFIPVTTPSLNQR